MATFAEVVPIPSIPDLERLTYRVPESMSDMEIVGARVLVPLGRRRVTAIVTRIGDDAPPGVRCKDLLRMLDDRPILTPGLLELAAWMSRYYAAPLAEVFTLAVPRGLTSESRKIVALTCGAEARGTLEQAIIDRLSLARGVLEVGRLRRMLGGKGVDLALKRMAARGALRIDESLAEPSIRPHREKFIELAEVPDPDAAPQIFHRAHKRRQIFEYLLGCPGRRVTVRELAELFPHPQQQITELEKLGIVRRSEVEVYRGVPADVDAAGPPELTPAQAKVVERIHAALGRFEVLLLHGVTSSGKTEVYLRAIEQALEEGGSALVLVPEISLTHQTVARLVGRFGPTVAVLHSELSARERWAEWRRLRRGDARIAVGARSAVLAPLELLRIVVVDEEHDAAYKQEDGVRYHGRDVAIMRAQLAACPVMLGSATPSIESWYNALAGRYHRLELPERVTASPLPLVEVVDLRGKDIFATGGLSHHLRELLVRNHAENGQALLFLNRRGYAGHLQCYECGEVEQCPHCSVGMTLHRDEGRLRCHHCDESRRVPERCSKCGKDSLTTQGLGTQRLEHTLNELLPDARVERLDRDSVRKKGRARDVLTEWRAGAIDVLIGTQMITKGHDVAGVTLVGVVHADLGLSVPDFRCAERTFQILTQVAGRAGRGERRGRVVLQTYRPDHFAVAAAARHDYETFAREELASRRELDYPPYSRMALLRFEGMRRESTEALAEAAGRSLRELARKTEGLIVRGPAPSPIERIKGRHRYQIQIRSSDGKLARHAASRARDAFRERARAEKIRLLVDVDPVEML
jgi:primosomal protein N' (replication factor Y)